MMRLTLVLVLLAGPAVAATPIDERRALDADGELSLDNLQGRIIVEAWDRAEVHVQGHLGEGTEGLEIDGDARELHIRVKYPQTRGWFGGWGGSNAQDSELKVRVPAGATLEVDSVSAEIQVRGMRGRELEIDSVSGDIEVESGSAALRIDSVSGDQRVRADAAEVALESVSGDIAIEGALDGRVTLEAVSGSISVHSSAAVKSIEVGAVSGDVDIRAALQRGGRISAETLSGDLELSLAAGGSARLEAASFTGNIRSDVGTVSREDHGPGSSLSTSIGAGEGRIELETFSGDLRIRME